MFPRWLSWLFLAFMGYLIVVGQRGPTAPETDPRETPPATHETVADDPYNDLHALMDGDRWKRALNPAYRTEKTPCAAVPTNDALPAYAIVETEGVGAGLACGDAAALRLTVWDSKGKLAKEIPALSLTLGAQEGLDALLLGMKEGEKRTTVITAPAKGYKTLPALRAGAVNIVTWTRLPASEH